MATYTSSILQRDFKYTTSLQGLLPTILDLLSFQIKVLIGLTLDFFTKIRHLKFKRQYINNNQVQRKRNKGDTRGIFSLFIGKFSLSRGVFEIESLLLGKILLTAKMVISQ